MSSVQVSVDERASQEEAPGHRQTAAPAGLAARPYALESAVLCAVPIVVVAVLGWRRRWMSDDGFINVRVVENLFAGDGPVYNVGERVEVGTSTLWLAALALGHAVAPFVAISRVAVYGGLLATVLGLVAVSAGAAVLWRLLGRSGPAIPLGTVVVAALPPFWDFATSGLETGLTFLWLGSSFLLLARRLARMRAIDAAPPPAWRPLWPAVVIGLGPLVRPDLTLIAAALGLALLAQSRRGLRSWSGAAAAALAIPITYEVFRAGYYATLVPNTALAKGAGSSLWPRGVQYLDDFAGRYVLLLPLVALALVLWAPSLVAAGRAGAPGVLALLAAPVVGGVLHGLFVIRVGGDFMHGRLLLPATLSVLMPVAVVVNGPGLRHRLQVLLPLLVVAPWAAVVAADVRPDYSAGVGSRGIADERRFYVAAAAEPNPVLLSDYTGLQSFDWFPKADAARARAERGERVFIVGDTRYPAADGYGVVESMGNIGIYGVAAGPKVFVADGLSLASAVGARLEVPPKPGARIGHAQEVPIVWDIARYARPSPEDPAGVRDARAALGCGDLARLDAAITGPLTPGRFLRNIRDAHRLTRLRVPVDPAAARAQLCGAGEGPGAPP